MDYSLSSTVYVKFTSSVNGVPTALAGSPAVSAYANGSTTELTAGITFTQDFDSRTGLNHIAVVASVANGYAAGTDYALVMTAGTLNGTSVVGTVVGEFSVEKESTVASLPQIKQVTDKLHSMLEAATGSPGESRFTEDALRNAPAGSGGGGGGGPSASAIATAVWAEALPGSYSAGQAGKILGDNLNATVGSRATQVSVDTIAGYLDTEVAAIKAKTDNLPSDPADASDIAAAFAAISSTLSTIDGRIDTEVPQIKQVTDKLHSMLEAAPGSPGESRFTADALVNTAVVLPNINAIKAKTDNLPSDPADASDIASSFGTVNATLATIAGYIDTEVAAIKAKTDNLPADPADASDIAAAFGTVNATLATIDGRLDTEVPQIKQVTDKLHSMLEAAPGSPGESRFTADALVNTAVVLPNINAIKAKTDNLPSDPADASDIASSFGTVNATLATIAGYIDTEVAAIKAKTDNLPTDPADASDIAASFSTVNATLATIDARLDTEVPQIKQVTDKLHSMLEAATGSPDESRFTADALRNAPTGSGGGGGSAPSAAAVAAAVWAEALPGAYSVGAAGRILGDNLNATVGSRATQTSVDTIAGYVDTEVAAIKAKTDNLPSDPADASDIATAFGTVNATLATIAGYIDTEVSAIKAKTDNLPASPAATSDIPTAADVAVQVWSEDLSGYTVDGSAGLALSETDLRGERTVCRGTVSGTAPTNTTFTPSALSPAGAATDQFKGRVILFDKATTTPELRGQATVITGSTSSSLPLLTFEALSHAPVSGDTFSIV